MEQIRVVLADFDEESSRAMAEELSAQEDIQVVGRTGEADRVLPLIRETRAQVLVLEMALRGGDGLEVVSKVKKELQDQIRVLVCSLFADRALVNGAVQRGADYYMIKPVSVQTLAEHIRLREQEEDTLGETDSLPGRVAKLLRQLGVMPNMKGYQYVLEAIVIAMEDPEAVCGVTKVIYPQIARRHKTSSPAVERAIRHAVTKAWENGNQRLFRQMFPDLGKGFHCPSNAVFIGVLTQLLLNDQRMLG